MKLIELDKAKRAKVSFEDEPELLALDCKKTEEQISVSTNALDGRRSFTLELMLPSNASYYALIGAQYIPGFDDNLHIEVRYTEGNTENYENTLAYSKKTVFKGLCKEYAETVQKTASNFLQSCDRIPSGKIVFDVAACCEVGSSPLIFRIATKIVLQVLLSKEQPVSDESIKSICEKYIVERNRTI